MAVHTEYFTPQPYTNGNICKAFSVPFPDMPEYTSYRLVA